MSKRYDVRHLGPLPSALRASPGMTGVIQSIAGNERRMWWEMKWVVRAAFLLLTARGAIADESWLNPPTVNVDLSCTQIDSVFITPVPDSWKNAAIARLETVSVVGLREDEAAAFLDATDDPQRASASGRVAAQAAKLLSQRRVFFEQKYGEWNAGYQSRLDYLEDLLKSGAVFRPYLVRGVALASSYGFFVRQCGSKLAVFNGGLGGGSTFSRWPVIVFLDHAPTDIWIYAATAR